MQEKFLKITIFKKDAVKFEEEINKKFKAKEVIKSVDVGKYKDYFVPFGYEKDKVESLLISPPVTIVHCIMTDFELDYQIEQEKVRLNLFDNDKSTPMTWDEFRDAGLLWFVNSTLFKFGVGILVNKSGQENVQNHIIPVKTNRRTFSEEFNKQKSLQFAKYLKDNIDDINSTSEDEEVKINV